MKKIIFSIAIAGWILALIVNFALIAEVGALDKEPSVKLLHVGIFIVFIPAIFISNKDEAMKVSQQSEIQENNSISSALNYFFDQTPTWLKNIAIASMLYAIINFILCLIAIGNIQHFEDGQYVRLNHGIVQFFTQEEYYQYKLANKLRAGTGHWLIFYIISATLVCPFTKRNNS